MIFLALLLLPLVIVGVSYVLAKGSITPKELAVHVAAQIVVAGASAAIVYWNDTSDEEVWNGTVASKTRVEVSCSHSYSCHCHEECSGSGKNRSCSEHCDTCYEHPYDVDWRIKTTTSDTVDIDRVDRRGLIEPPRWTAVVLGEPTAIAHDYTSYIKAAPDTLFRHQENAARFPIPPYPKVYDYYRMDRLVLWNGASVADPRDWNRALSEMNAAIGSAKQVNFLVVFVKGTSSEFFDALEARWIGGKKNDVILVAGVDDQGAAQWARVMAWTTDETVKVRLRDDVMTMKNPLDAELVVQAAKKDILEGYKRKPMADFEYLEASIAPTEGEWVVSMTVGITIAIVLAIVFARVDVFGEERERTWTA